MFSSSFANSLTPEERRQRAALRGDELPQEKLPQTEMDVAKAVIQYLTAPDDESDLFYQRLRHDRAFINLGSLVNQIFDEEALQEMTPKLLLNALQTEQGDGRFKTALTILKNLAG